MSVWRDEHPDRFGPLTDGCFCVIQGIDDHAHFIKIYLDPDGGGIGPLPEVHTACDVPFPIETWFGANRTQFPMGGIVDCEECLALMQKDQET